MRTGIHKHNKFTLWLLIITLITTTIMFAFAFYETRHLDHLKRQYMEDTRGISTETALLNQLARENGYGGFIHNFKNFVLRQDIRYLNAARSNMTEIKNVFFRYRSLPLSPEKQDALNEIENVFQQYAEKLLRVDIALEEGLPIDQIDQRVKVDDVPALQALEFLIQQNKLESDQMRNNTSQMADNALQKLTFVLPAMLAFFLFITLIIAWMVLQQSGNKNLTSTPQEYSGKNTDNNAAIPIRDILNEWPSHALILIIGLSLAFSVAWIKNISQEDRARESFTYLAQTDAAIITQQLEWHKHILEKIGSFYASSKDVTYDEFSSFVANSLQSHPSYDAIGWIDYTKDSDSFIWVQNRPIDIPYRDADDTGIILPSDSEITSLLQKSRIESYSLFAVIPNNIGFKDIHRLDQTEDPAPHFMLLHPVYQNSNLIGLSYSLLDIPLLVKEALLAQSENTRFVYHTIRIEPQTGGEIQTIYNDMPAGHTISPPYQFTQGYTIGPARLIWEFTPTKAFIESYKTNNSYVIFLILAALTFSILFIRQMMKNIQNLKIAREKAEEANRLKSSFLATMSHEIRTPMNGILGMAELILNIDPPPKIRSHTQTILSSGEALLHIIDDILDFSKIEANKLSLEYMPTNLLEVVDELAALHAVKARDKAVELVVRYVPGSEQFVYADPLRLRQVLGNLVNNAIKFTEKGHIIIQVYETPETHNNPNEATLRFSVQDTGIGIAEDERPLIFDKFSQADHSTTRKYGGTGLGLGISKSLIEMMGGTLMLDSKKGEGSTFSFTLTLKRNKEHIHAKPRPLILEHVRILVVDDLPVIRLLLKEQLTEAGMNCDAAGSGEEALMKMRQAVTEGRPYDIVLIDYLMPQMNGEMLACAIKDEKTLASACLIMLTAAGNAENYEKFAMRGFSAYMVKPVSNHTLVETLALIWGKYQDGATDGMIHIDTQHFSHIHPDRPAYKLKGHHILVAEDNLVNQVFIQEVLEEMDVEYTIVSNGEEALAALSENRYDLVIMDCLMPVMDGFEASRRICEMKGQGELNSDLKIIALTANAMKGDREKCLEAGMDDYLSKPIRSRELKETVYAAIKGRSELMKKRRITTSASNVVPIKQDVPQIENSTTQTEVTSSPSYSSDTSAVLDTQTVTNARKMLKSRYEEMVHIYLHTSEEYIAELKKSLSAQQIAEMIRPAHSLKSSSRQMGAVKLADFAFEIEKAAKSATREPINGAALPEDIPELLRELEHIFAQTQTALQDEAA